MKILVTGVAGFVGFNIAKELINRGYEIVGIDVINDYYDVNLKKRRLSKLNDKNFTFCKIDISDKEKVSEIFKKEKPDTILHLAAQAGVRYSLINPDQYIKSNIVGFFNIIDQCRLLKIKNFYYASSSSVYGNSANYPFDEEDKVDEPLNLYAVSKKSNEEMAYAYSNLYDINCIGLRFFTVYGPWGRPDMAYYKFVNNIIFDKEIKVYGNGKMKRDFTYIDDVVKVVINLIENAKFEKSKIFKSKIFNIGNSNPVELSYFIKVIEEAIGKSASKIYLEMQDGDMSVTCANTKKLKDEINLLPNTKIEEGIPRFVTWFKNYYKLN